MLLLLLPVTILSCVNYKITFTCYEVSYVYAVVYADAAVIGCFDRHGEGKVCFWDMTLSAATNLLYCLDTASMFVSDTDQQETTGAPADEDWPPFRKVSSLHS